MAGAGYKLFATGDVLTAAQVNTYLNEQTVMVFADSAARTTALSGVLAEGMMSYLQDTNAVQVYNGTSWVSVGGASPLTTKGDLFTFSTVDARLGVGANGTFLSADSGEATGLKWSAPSSMTLLSTTSLTGATTTISGINQTYIDLYLLVYGVTNATANGDFRIAPNGTTNASSGQISDGGQNTFTLKVADYMFITFGTSTNNKITFNNSSNAFAIRINDYASAASFKPYLVNGSFHATNAGGVGAALVGGAFNSNTAITSLVFSNSGGDLSAGTVEIYGVK